MTVTRYFKKVNRGGCWLGEALIVTLVQFIEGRMTVW
jgi:hypothetical protein